MPTELKEIEFYSMTGAAEYCNMHYNLFRNIVMKPPKEFPQPLQLVNARGRNSLFFTRNALDAYKSSQHWAKWANKVNKTH